MFHSGDRPETDWLPLIIALISSSLLYVGGCFLGDVRDLSFDRKLRPNRPLPQGIINPVTVHRVAWACFFVALLLASFHPPSPATACILTLAILSYAVFHKTNRILALSLMGTCRALLILYAFSFVQPSLQLLLSPPSLTLALIVGIYTVFLSSVAATESSPEKVSFRKPLFTGMLTLPLLAYAFIHGTHPIAFGVAFLIYLLWTARSFKELNHSKPVFVSRSLAGFCLLDACLATAYAPCLGIICLFLFIGSLSLQKLAPAT